MNYRIYFTSNQTLDITAEVLELIRLYSGKGPLTIIRSNDDKYLVLNINNVAYIVPVHDNPSAVVKPKTPEELREEKEVAEAQKARDVDSVLNEAKAHQTEANG